MSTTLTNGLKLPDKGSVDWYADMQNNYTILDGAVGTIADHTTAIAGKAASSHTHTKSDVTDLLNSNFIPSANNSYDLGSSSYQWNNAYIKSLTINGVACGDILTHNASEFVHIKGSDDIIDSKTFISLYTQSIGPSLWMKNTSFTMGTAPTTNRYSGIWVQDNNGADTAYIVHQANKNNSQNLKFSVSNTDGTTVYQNALTFQGRLDGIFNFYSDNPANLGTSSSQWNNLYAKNYFYNGVAWGLDQANVWTGRQTYGAYLKSFGEARTDEWSGNSRTNAYLLSRRDTNDVSGFLISTFRSNQAQGTAGHIYGWDILENSTRYSGLRFTIDWDSALNSGNGAYKVTLGTNTQGTNPCNDLHITQLKTINGINPGALSICNPSATQDPIDVPNTWVTNGSAWNTLNVSNMGDGWICLTYRLCGPNDYILARFGGTNANTYPSMIFPATRLADSGYFVYALMPVAKAMGNIYLEIKLDSNAVLVKHSFIPAYGTV